MLQTAFRIGLPIVPFVNTEQYDVNDMIDSYREKFPFVFSRAVVSWNSYYDKECTENLKYALIDEINGAFTS